MYHFTRADNLYNILEHGILPRTELERRGISYVYNDDLRLDGFKDASSFSISFPNYKMFYLLRKYSNAKWCVIEVSSSILWEKECIFCFCNAASNVEVEIPVDEKKGIDALRRLFNDMAGFPAREQLDIPSNYPTNPQAEVLVIGIVEKEYIKRIIFNSARIANEYANRYNSDIEFVCDDFYFGPRSDYEHWR